MDSKITECGCYLKVGLSLHEIKTPVRDYIESLELELSEYRNAKNWTRPYNYQGNLINQHALFLPKLK